MPAAGPPQPLATRVLARLLDDRRKLDYLWLALAAASPLALAWFIGVAGTHEGFAGYATRANWTSLTLILPAAVLGLRWITRRIGPISSPELPPLPPPVIRLLPTQGGRAQAYAALRAKLLAPVNLHLVLLVTLAIHLADLASLGGVYLSGATGLCSAAPAPPCAADLKALDGKPSGGAAETGRVAAASAQTVAANSDTASGMARLRVPSVAGRAPEVEKDWSVAYLRSGGAVGKGANLALNGLAYAVQFAVVAIAMLALLLIVRHNLFFLGRIYQRRRVPPEAEAAYIHIDLDDDEKCFGFREANDAFNGQVLSLAVAAVFVVATRFANVGPADDGNPATGLFPDIGQIIAMVAWLVGLTIVSMPILVKLLPRLGVANDAAADAPNSLVGYLREFLSDRAWAIGPDTPRDEIDAVAARFADNAFWPTGNNRAWQLYWVSFTVFLVAMVPDPRAIAALGDWPTWSRYASWPAAAALAWGMTWALFRLLRVMLTFVDPRLVDPPPQAAGSGVVRRRRIPIGLFISYRRGETAAYTGRLYDSLADHIDKDRLFMDLDTIRGGADFVAEMKKAIGSAQAMVVVIGPDWLTLKRADGQPRIHDPGDFVRLEVALGLQREMAVYPVLVGGATMPALADLPDDLKKLASLNAREISDSRWVHDVGRLVEDLGTPKRARPRA